MCGIYIFNKYTLLSQAFPMMVGVNECACLSALIVNETLTQIQHSQIFTPQPGDFITDKCGILQEVLHFFICYVWA